MILGFDRPAPNEPGVYPNIAHHAYHADRHSISSSWLRRLNRTAPRQFKYELDHPKITSTKYFDLGTVVHTLVFGVGPEIVVVYEDAWRKDTAKAERAAAWEQGKTPILEHEYEQAKAMADAVLNHPIAGPLVADSIPELSIYERDPVTGIMLRVRPDGYNDTEPPLLLVDLKTSTTADPVAFRYAARDFGYDEQAALYIDVVRMRGLADDVIFLFIVVAKEAPHLVSVIELPSRALERGRHFNRKALDRYARCLRTDSWPEFAEDVVLADLPRSSYYGLELQ